MESVINDFTLNFKWIMNNLERYNEVFKNVFEVTEDSLQNEFSPDTIQSWDSITHLSLIESLEEEFDIMMDSEDILGLRSYRQGKDILAKYEVNF